MVLLVCSVNVEATANSPAKPLGIVYEDDEVELTATCYLAESDAIIVFIPSVYAPFEDQEKFAAEIAANGLSACFSHVFTDLFLPMKSSYYESIPLGAMLALVATIKRKTQKPVYMVAHGSGNRIIYGMAKLSMLLNKDTHSVAGAILLSPNLLADTPEPGKDQQYMSLVHEKTIPLFIFQPSYSPHHWHLETLLAQIRASGTKVRFRQLPDVRDGYALREDRTEKEQALREQAAQLFIGAIEQLKNE